MKLYKKLGVSLTVLTLALGTFSCKKDFLDREPKSDIAENQYLLDESHLANYTINYYNSVFSSHGGWNMGAATWDNDTDNQADQNANYGRFVVGQTKTASSGSLNFQLIRACNYFIEKVNKNLEEGRITGNMTNIKHYLGEMYVIRAIAYYIKLKTYGDFPIVLETLPTDEAVLTEHAKRRPCNMVARQILSDFDKALELLQEQMSNKNRITRNAALVLKARVALFEATFLKYHNGTPRVPGQAGWPGANMEYNKGFSLDVDSEVNFFLQQAMDAAKEVAEKISLTTNNHVFNPTSGQLSNWNPYYEMFSAKSLASFDEVLLWREYNLSLGINHGVGAYARSGGATGYTKAFVESFLMENGLPIYATGSGYAGDNLISKVKEGRDERLQLFLFDENTPLKFNADGSSINFDAPQRTGNAQSLDITGYRPRKYLNYDPNIDGETGLSSMSGHPVIRAVEAYLIYIEASYLLNGKIDSYADKYWRAIRTRAGVDPDYTKTIEATDMEQEKADWGAYSGGQLLTDKTLYNIRRERRCEFIAEGRRWEDLLRWRALDQVKNYIIEGCNFWTEIYKNKAYINDKTGVSVINDKNMSPRDESVYIRPYRIVRNANNLVLNGYNTYDAIYLSPISYREMELASPTGDASKSNLYQTVYWPLEPNLPALQ